MEMAGPCHERGRKVLERDVDDFEGAAEEAGGGGDARDGGRGLMAGEDQEADGVTDEEAEGFKEEACGGGLAPVERVAEDGERGKGDAGRDEDGGKGGGQSWEGDGGFLQPTRGRGDCPGRRGGWQGKHQGWSE